MNNPNPFVPKGSLLELQSQRRSRLKLAVFCVLAISVTGLVAMLIQGCKRENPESSAVPPMDTNLPAMDMSNTPPPSGPDTNLPGMPAPEAPTNMPAGNVVTPEIPAPQAPVQPPQAMETGGGTYTVVPGDTLGKIAKAHGVSLKALEAANPGVDPKKLKPKQQLNIPAGAKATESTMAAPTNAGEAGGGEKYVVKSGDTLSRIAHKHGVSLKALRAANPKIASTDHIKVGDKLTIPGKGESAAPAPAPATDTPALPVPPSSMPTSAPAPMIPAPAPGR